MKKVDFINSKIFDLPTLLHIVQILRLQSKTISFTNGCFDILHRGHIASLSEAAKEADFLIVGLNSDLSTKKTER